MAQQLIARVTPRQSSRFRRRRSFATRRLVAYRQRSC